MPSHTHKTGFAYMNNIDTNWALTKTSPGYNDRVVAKMLSTGEISTGSAGSTNAHNNMQPYQTIYMWRRSA